MHAPPSPLLLKIRKEGNAVADSATAFRGEETEQRAEIFLLPSALPPLSGGFRSFPLSPVRRDRDKFEESFCSVITAYLSLLPFEE